MAIAVTLAVATLSAAAPATATTPARNAGVVASALPPSFDGKPSRNAVETATVMVVRFYRVVPGDTLGGIAGRFCGSFGAYPALAAASGIRNPDLIYPGQDITLSCAARVNAGAVTVAKTAPAPVKTSPPSTRAQRALAFALAQVGKPYRWGAAGPGAYDCSGLVMAAYASVGISLPHFSGAQVNYGWRVSRADLRPGDLVFPYASLGHVMIYVGGGRVVEAPHPGLSVRVINLYGFYTARRLV